MSQFSWRKGYTPPIEAEVFGKAAEQIAAQNGGFCQPADIVAEAAKPGSPLRPALMWDDAKAAHAHRLQQARQMLGALQVTRVAFEAGSNLPQRALYRVASDAGSGYASVSKIMGDRDLTLNLMKTARRELESFMQRYGSVVAFGRHVPGLNATLDAMRDHLDEIETAAKRRTEAQRFKGEKV